MLKSPKKNALADGLIERNSSTLDETASKIEHKDKVIGWEKWIKTLSDTHMEELVLYWIKYKIQYKVGCFWRFS